MRDLFCGCGYEEVSNNYVSRKTVNKKEGLEVKRIFVQSKFRKSSLVDQVNNESKLGSLVKDDSKEALCCNTRLASVDDQPQAATLSEHFDDQPHAATLSEHFDDQPQAATLSEHFDAASQSTNSTS